MYAGDTRESKADFLHIPRNCSVIQNFWHTVIDLIHDMTGYQLPFDPKTTLLHFWKETASGPDLEIILSMLTAAKLCTEATGKKPNPPIMERHQKIHKTVLTTKLNYYVRSWKALSDVFNPSVEKQSEEKWSVY